jgi:mono/diheme cytochrome c family protein
MKALTLALLAFAAALVAGSAFVYSGMFNVAADDPHWDMTLRVLTVTRDRSIAVRADGVQPVALDNPALIREGADHYEDMCEECHLAPGMSDTDLRAGLYPQPPNFSAEGVHRKPEEVFWIVKHGLKMTGMPAWGVTHDDEDIWGMVAFVQRLSGMSADEYRRLASEGRGRGRGRGHDDEDDHSHDR